MSRTASVGNYSVTTLPVDECDGARVEIEGGFPGTLRLRGCQHCGSIMLQTSRWSTGPSGNARWMCHACGFATTTVWTGEANG